MKTEIIHTEVFNSRMSMTYLVIIVFSVLVEERIKKTTSFDKFLCQIRVDIGKYPTIPKCIKSLLLD